MNLWKLVQKLFGRGVKPLADFDPVRMIQERERWWGVDFDGTLVDWSLEHFGQPKVYKLTTGRQFTSIDVLHLLRKKRQIIVYSCRVNASQPEAERAAACSMMTSWLQKHHAPIDAIWGMRFKNGIWEFCADDVGKPVCAGYWCDLSYRADNAGTEQMIKESAV